MNKFNLNFSNKQLINLVEKLYRTDPSKENRTINYYIVGLEAGTIGELDILIYKNTIDQKRPNKSQSRSRVGTKENDEENPYIPVSTYVGNEGEGGEHQKGRRSLIYASPIIATILAGVVISVVIFTTNDDPNFVEPTRPPTASLTVTDPPGST